MFKHVIPSAITLQNLGIAMGFPIELGMTIGKKRNPDSPVGVLDRKHLYLIKSPQTKKLNQVVLNFYVVFSIKWLTAASLITSVPNFSSSNNISATRSSEASIEATLSFEVLFL